VVLLSVEEGLEGFALGGGDEEADDERGGGDGHRDPEGGGVAGGGRLRGERGNNHDAEARPDAEGGTVDAGQGGGRLLGREQDGEPVDGGEEEAVVEDAEGRDGDHHRHLVVGERGGSHGTGQAQRGAGAEGLDPAAAAGEPAGQRRGEDADERGRGEEQQGGEGRTEPEPGVGILAEQHHGEVHDGEDAGEGQDGGGDDGPHLAGAQVVDGDERVAAPFLDHPEGGEGRHGAGQQGQGARGGPAGGRPAGDEVGDEHQEHRERARSPPVHGAADALRPPLRDGPEDAAGGDGGEHQHDGEDGPEAEGLGHQAADVAVHSPDAAVDGGDDAHGGAEDARLQVLAEHDVGEREDRAGHALQEAAGDEQRQGGRGDAEEGAGAHDGQHQQEGGAAADEVAPPADHGAGDGAGEEEHGLHGGGGCRRPGRSWRRSAAAPG
jgi:hypothetical protein